MTLAHNMDVKYMCIYNAYNMQVQLAAGTPHHSTLNAVRRYLDIPSTRAEAPTPQSSQALLTE